ncbi:MAG TPA: copper resistance CopC family protein [Thermodesulfovibrionales bacterium]|nr:copper resistance CopC family protein [Thermodesulfovibrionales bacterium]
MVRSGERLIGVLWQTALALLVLWAGSGLACAHSVVIESSPKDNEVLTRAPREVLLRFNVKIEKSLARIRLETRGGREIPQAQPTESCRHESPDRLTISLPDLGPGDYLLRYKVLSMDGHATSGVLHFRVVNGP